MLIFKLKHLDFVLKLVDFVLKMLDFAAPYVRVGPDTIDSWGGSIEQGFSELTRAVAPSIRPHHFGDLASLMVGKVHCVLWGANTPGCMPGPDYYIPGNRSHLTAPEVLSYASLVSIFRSSWWPSGVITEMNEFQFKLMTNDAVIRVAMMSQGTRQVVDLASPIGDGIVWTADDSEMDGWKYVLLVNRGAVELVVAVDFVQLGLTFQTECNVTELWDSHELGLSYRRLEATLEPHASLFARLSGCKEQLHPPPTPGTPS